MAGRGKAFEKWLDLWCGNYARQGRAMIHKVDPPTRVVGRGKIIFMPNPFLDYIGTWTEQGGRTIVLEAKANLDATTRLPVNVTKGDGLRCNQWEWMEQWERGGAVTGVLWWNGGELRVVTPGQIRAAITAGRKSVELRKTFPVREGDGFLDTLLCLQ